MSKTKFDVKMAFKLVNLCVEAYKPIEEFNVEQHNLEMVKIIDNKDSDIQGFLARDKGNWLYVVFRGANSAKDYLRDLNIFHAKFPASRRFLFKPGVHAGFYNGYLSVRETIFKELKENKYDRIFVTGHSMGAALAVFCALDIRKTFNNFVSLFTYGCPEVGNRWFVRRFKKLMYQDGVLQSFRVVNDEDIIPKINILTIQHVPKMIFIDGHGKLNLNPTKLEIIKEMMDDFISVLTGEAISDHLSKNYQAVLKKLQ